jgi:hypothetical protein
MDGSALDDNHRDVAQHRRNRFRFDGDLHLRLSETGLLEQLPVNVCVTRSTSLRTRRFSNGAGFITGLIQRRANAVGIVEVSST